MQETTTPNSFHNHKNTGQDNNMRRASKCSEDEEEFKREYLKQRQQT